MTKSVPIHMVTILRSQRFAFIRQRGSHTYYKHPDGRSVVVPMHAGEDLGRGMIREILRTAEITVEDYERLRKSL